LPGVTVEHVDGTPGILCGSKKDGTMTARTVVRAKGDICTENSASLAEKVFEVLPTDPIGKLWWRSVSVRSR
jgi:hypothetical protein